MIADPEVKAAQAAREERLLNDFIDERLDVLLSHEDVSPRERTMLRNLLKHYAKMAHPFRACVRDNMKRFGPGRTEKICATIKDMIAGTHRWRSVETSDAPDLSERMEEILMAIDDDDLEMIVMEAAHG